MRARSSRAGTSFSLAEHGWIRRTWRVRWLTASLWSSQSSCELIMSSKRSWAETRSATPMRRNCTSDSWPPSPPAAVVAGIDAASFHPDRLAIRDRELYLHLPIGMGRSKLPAYLDRQLKIPVTIRNWNTVTMLCELSGS